MNDEPWKSDSHWYDMYCAARETLAAIRGALSTEETGENLVAVARAAHEAERRLASIAGLIGNVDHSHGGGYNTAKMYGEMLKDIRTIAMGD